MIPKDTPQIRQSVIDGCLWMNANGVNHGTSGNVSVRVEDGFLITPSATVYDAMTPDMICKLPLTGQPSRDLHPSTEWQFHQAVFAERPDVNAIVHAHPVHATTVAIARHEIPAIHYMIAAFGGTSVPLASYALFGSERLAEKVVQALSDRHGCLMANHGALTVGDTLDRALWRMRELETLAHQFILTDFGRRAQILSDEDIAEALTSFAGYGQR